MRRLYKTGEFLAVALLNLGTLLASGYGSLPPKWAAITGAISVSALAISRGITKLGDPALNGSPAERVTAVTKPNG